MSILIRPESQADRQIIGEITRQAFASHPHSNQTEHFIIEALRQAKALTISLVAEYSGRVVGHIAFSPAAISDGSIGWYILGPISVVPALQGRGIGRQLIENGLSQLKELGASGCILVGDPLFYNRFGFIHPSALVMQDVPTEYLLAQSFGSNCPQGEVEHHVAFLAKG